MAGVADVVLFKRKEDSNGVPSGGYKPAKSRKVILPCPNAACSELGEMKWVCFECQSDMEYAFDNIYLYCLCGKVDLMRLLFKCPYDESFIRDEESLKNVLVTLEPFTELNILILGETGVGKSTFINAFANYLTYYTVEEAMNGKIITLIPNKFFVTDANYNSICIRNGEATQEESIETGQSSTQATKVHKFTIRNTILRIIDTPGIGDVRGPLQDNKNFKNILDTIASYDRLHGIIILLKPNNAKLSIIFRYCIQELLTHLHKSAVKNLIFGFTNTRGTDFRPGDTLPALKELLAKQPIGIELSKENIYCFDSESYRFLSAISQGIDFDEDLADSYRRSWVYSVKETQRLVSYIRQLTPHMTQQTLSVNNTRIHILHLTKPMAEITKNIMMNVKGLDHLKEIIKDVDEQNQSLLGTLMIEKIDLERVELGHPRTVCTNSACVKMTDINGIKKTNYTQWCHTECYLKEIPVETTNNPQLIHCRAMYGEYCKKCHHHYTEHMHITFDMKEKIVKVEDDLVKRKIAKKTTFREQKKTKLDEVQRLIEEYKTEHLEVEKTAAKFGAFLKHNAITPYSDARLDYLDFIISEEKKKPSDCRDNVLLNKLEETKHIYNEQRIAIDTTIQAGHGEEILDPANIEVLISNLCKLPHFGKTFAQFKTVFEKTPNNFRNEVAYDYSYFQRPQRPHNPQRNMKNFLENNQFVDTVFGVYEAYKKFESKAVNLLIGGKQEEKKKNRKRQPPYYSH